MEVRRYRPADSRECVELFRQLIEAHRLIYHDRTVGSEGPVRAWRAHIQEAGAQKTWVALQDGHVVGLVGLISRRGYGEAEPVVVAKGFRRRGVARRLLQTVIREARHRGWKFLAIKPVARNSVALRTFHALGFQVMGHLELELPLKWKGWFVPKRGPTIAGRRFRL
jgi:L-amino acid N-acyltransferase YncA